MFVYNGYKSKARIQGTPMSVSIRVDEHFPCALESADVQYLDCDLIHRAVPVAAVPVFVVAFHYSTIAFKW